MIARLGDPSKKCCEFECGESACSSDLVITRDLGNISFVSLFTCHVSGVSRPLCYFTSPPLHVTGRDPSGAAFIKIVVPLIAGFLRRQLGLQYTHSLLQIHARVTSRYPLKVLCYLLHDLLQTLGGREVVVIWSGGK